MRKFIIQILCISFVLTSCNAQTSLKIKKINAVNFEKKLITTKKSQLIDVRTIEEFNTGHINNAKNINWNGSTFESEVKLLDKTKPIFVYCKAGGRSAKAAVKLEEMGFKEIYDLEGGITNWNSQNLPLKK